MDLEKSFYGIYFAVYFQKRMCESAKEIMYGYSWLTDRETRVGCIVYKNYCCYGDGDTSIHNNMHLMIFVPELYL